MSGHTFDTFTRQTADAVSRRGSLLTLGGAALAAGLAGSGGTKARKKGGKGKKCKKQVGKCREGLGNVCAALFENQDSIDECFGLFAECCAFLKSCNAGQAFACATEIAETIDP